MAIGFSKDIELPMHYHDYWIADGWEVDKVGGKQVLTIG